MPADKRLDAATALKTKGNAQFNAKNYPEAIRLYTQAIAFNPDPVFYSNRAACFANSGQYDNVVADCTEALKMDPQYVKALNRRAQAHEKKGMLQEALYDFTAVCIIDGFKNEAASTSMERLLKRVSEEKARELFKSKKPRLPSPTFVTAYLDSFRPDKDPIEEIADADSGDAHYFRARTLLKERRYDDAMDAYDRAVELGVTRTAKALNMRGTFTFLKGNPKDALEDFNKAIEADPKYLQTYIKRASIYMEQGDPVETYKQFDEAIKIDPTDPDIYYHRCARECFCVNFITGDFDNAAKDYAESIKLDPSFVYAHIQLGVAQYKMGSITSAMSTFKGALKQFPESADVNNYYGELLLDQQRLEDAMEKFEKAMELDPRNPLPYINKALLVFQFQQNMVLAEELCREALKADANCDVAIATLAQLMLQQGRTADAIEWYEKTVELARTEAELSNAVSYLEALIRGEGDNAVLALAAGPLSVRRKLPAIQRTTQQFRPSLRRANTHTCGVPQPIRLD
ncbi:hypothetical protein BC936DRAFT_137755 [Jimgerdemannia flammicorona]|uniref:Mitochondrial outer membrane translocase receptor TOM70 n=1 Tax=Jimgerdemannia flammicorona TaxID=994334 RepID=A0A433CWR8_9FUNG|nr:hypothetical protein BC936DRAFT_137755 [Jimgerdemannia flammicorona]